MPTVNIIGAGRVGRTMLRLLGPQVQDVSSARIASAVDAVREVGQGRAVELSDMRPADVWCLTVPDTEISNVSQSLTGLSVSTAVAIHFSGFHTADAMSALRAEGWQLASAHPNLSFADPDVAARDFAGTPVGVEGDAPAVEVITALMTELGARPFEIASEHKVLYHAAAVFSNNFATVLQAIAREAWAEAGVPEDMARAMNAALLDATARNVAALGPAEALTGPAARGDRDVVEDQAARVLDWRPEIGQLYRDLSDLAIRLKTTGRTD